MTYQITCKRFVKMCKYYHDRDLNTDDKKKYGSLWNDYIDGAECDVDTVHLIIEHYLVNKKDWNQFKVNHLLNDILTTREYSQVVRRNWSEICLYKNYNPRNTNRV
jgi:hypothetical protein